MKIGTLIFLGAWVAVVFTALAWFARRAFREAEVQDTIDPGFRDPLLEWFERMTFWPFNPPRSRRPGRCAKCDYDLRATPDRCPECGTVNRRSPRRRK